MAELNVPPCPVHGAHPRSLHTENFEGIVTVIEELLETVSGVGSLSYARCPYGYPYNFEGVVRALEDLNVTVSGLRTSSVVPGSGITIRPSGDFDIFDVNTLGIGGVSVAYSGTIITISGTNNAATAVVSGIVAGEGIIVIASGGSAVISTNLSGVGSVEFNYDGTGVGLISGVDTSAVVVSGSPGAGYKEGALWFDTNEGRLFVYASGNSISDPDWYQTNAEALAVMSEVPPSGTGLNSPARDGQIWFNTLMGNLFIYDAISSGWYETAPTFTPAYGSSPPVGVVEGANFIDNSIDFFRYWNGSEWVILGSG
jgi:hypothetical protein